MDEEQKAITKAIAAEYTNKHRQAIYRTVEYVQQKRRRFSKADVAVITTVCEVAVRLVRLTLVKLRLGIARFNAGVKTMKIMLCVKKKEIVDTGYDVCNIHAPEDENNIDVVNVDLKPDSHYTEARKMELYRWDFYLRRKYQN
ncbi:1938_t:CDS:2 [Diversispora eburnea]|uniref:1938_t:CDS:1 n=1 Tax=Diversispora eburnea TaxID=1213867 RepID=A0A9N9G540_9GLOM|nr:1938_t:CDS:2 [Diversispora eburnea]